MKKYLKHKFSSEDKNLISVIDELPLWSAPFGMSLLNTIKMREGMKVLDIGSGLGFPLIEIAQRLGESSSIYGIDPWKAANDRVKLKIKTYAIKNVKVLKAHAEKLPFENSYFDLLVSNNGINNVGDLDITFSECERVSKHGAQFVFTMNLDSTMIEFYNILKSELEKRKLYDAAIKMREHIYHKRRPLNEMKKLLTMHRIKIKKISQDVFYLRFFDAASMLNHSFIKYWFLPSWKEITDEINQEEIFNSIENRLNKIKDKKGEIKLRVPFATFDCEKAF